MAALEGCIRCGLIQSNTGYDELFGATTIGAQITDHGFRVKSASCSALPISLEKMEQALEGPVQLDKNTLLKGQEISSGYVFWQEDISDLQGVLDRCFGSFSPGSVPRRIPRRHGGCWATLW